MKLAASHIGWDLADDQKVYSMMKTYGFTGVEIAPTKIFPVDPYDHLEKARAWKEQLWTVYGFTIPSMQSIWYGKQENIFGQEKERDSLISYTKCAIDFAVGIGCGNIVFGCPKNRMIPMGADSTPAIPFFQEIAGYARKKGTVIGFEANPAIYHTNYMNDTKSALTLIKEIKSEAFRLNLDVGTMIQNNEEIAVLEGNVSFINHVHMSEPYLKPIQRRPLHHELASILKQENYTGYVSMEIGKVSDLSVLARSLEYIQEVFG